MLTDDQIRENIPKNIRLCREAAGLSQTELGVIFGKAKTTVATWEQGKSLPDVVTLHKLAVFFGKSLSFMYENNNEMNQ